MSEEHMETEDDLTLIYYSLYQCLSMLQKVFFSEKFEINEFKPTRFEECFGKKYWYLLLKTQYVEGWLRPNISFLAKSLNRKLKGKAKKKRFTAWI